MNSGSSNQLWSLRAECFVDEEQSALWQMRNKVFLVLFLCLGFVVVVVVVLVLFFLVRRATREASSQKIC